MGYLVRSEGMTNFSKAVISLWFRVPQVSLDAARAQYDAANAIIGDADLSLIGVIPLLTFGPNAETYVNHNGVAGAVTSTGAISPCVIGISCGDSGDGVYRNVLYARMQYANGAASPVFPNNVYNDFFQVGARLSPSNVWGSSGPGSFITVTADQWHHVLVSFDLSAGCSSTYSAPNLAINTTCPFYWAFDDVNRNSGYLFPNTPVIVGATDVPNGIFSDRCIQNSGSFSFAAGAIPTNGKPFGIPSSSGNVSKIYDVNLGYLQVFTGVTLDTSVEANRRAFVKANGTPETDYTIADGLLGTPVIRLSSGRNWKAGTNTGSLGGTFTKAGTINLYTPGPFL